MYLTLFFSSTSAEIPQAQDSALRQGSIFGMQKYVSLRSYIHVHELTKSMSSSVLQLLHCLKRSRTPSLVPVAELIFLSPYR